jgi:hypothetical protein
MIAIITLFVFISLTLLLLPRPTVSELENRNLTEFPEFTLESYLDGSFTRNLTKWFADTVPFRDNLVEISGVIKEYEGIRQNNVKFHGNVELVATEPADETAETVDINTLPPVTAVPEQETAMPILPGETVNEPVLPQTAAVTDITTGNTDKQAENGTTMEFDNNGIVTVGDRSFMLFGGNKTQGKYYADVLNAYKTALGEDVNVYNMLIPTAVEFYLPAEYAEYSNSELEQINYIYRNLSGVIPIDAYSKLSAHTDEPIYLKTDHHWAQLGAYYASTAFAELLGEDIQPLSDFEMKVRTGFVGSLYGYTNDIKIKDSPEEFAYYLQTFPYSTYFYKYDTLAPMGAGHLFYEKAPLDNSYGIFIGADAIHTQVVTENKNGKKLCVFKESFGNALIPELVPYFEEIYVIDIRFFGMNAIDYMKSKNITDVLFVNNIFAANTNLLINYLNALRSGPVGLTSATTAETSVTETPAAEMPAENAFAPVQSAPPQTTAPVQTIPGEIRIYEEDYP